MDNKNIIIKINQDESNILPSITIIDILRDEIFKPLFLGLNIQLSNSFIEGFQKNNNEEDPNQNINNTLNNLIESINEQLLNKSIGYILEKCIKSIITNIILNGGSELISPYKDNFKFDRLNTKWYDFLYNRNQVKLVIFEKKSPYSTTTLTTSQYENRKNMIFISIIYTFNSDEKKLTITDIFVNNGKDIKVKNEKVSFNSINPITIVQSEENLDALRLTFTSNSEKVQIINV